jgi:uncharacterized membrane protein/mono/diheme cytochrome c family protein
MNLDPFPRTGLAQARFHRVLGLAVVALFAASAAGAIGAGDSYSINPDTLAKFFGRTHAILVHFPIAMLIVAAVLEVIAALRDRFGRPAEHPLTLSHAGLVCVGFGTAGAIAASAAGWFNADIEGVGSSVESNLFWHRWLGITVCVLAVVIAIAGLAGRSGVRRRPVVVYRGVLLLTAALVGFTGHLGGNMVYGSDYLQSAFKVRAPKDPSKDTDGLVARGEVVEGAVEKAGDGTARVAGETPPDNQTTGGPSLGVVTPAVNQVNIRAQEIFDARCIDCHGSRRAKGDLRLDTLDFAKTSTSVIAGKPDESDLIQRLLLPEDHDDYMPAEDPPLPQEEINALRAWVSSLAGAAGSGEAGAGSVPDVGKADSTKPDGTQPEGARPDASTPDAGAQGSGNGGPASSSSESKPVPAKAASKPQVKPEPVVLTPEQRAARDQAIVAIRKAGAYAGPISNDSELVHANFAIMGKACTDQSLALLAGLEPVLHELNLSGTSVTDAGLKQVTSYGRLERLNLSRTPVTDVGVATVASMKSLTWLNLHNTAVGDAAIDAMAAMQGLRGAVLWRTGMTEGGISRLAAARTDLVIETGATIVKAPVEGDAAVPVATQAAGGVPPAEAKPEAKPEEGPLPLALRLPGCCKSAKDQGKECDHPCCVAARGKGEVCAKCLGP